MTKNRVKWFWIVVLIVVLIIGFVWITNNEKLSLGKEISSLNNSGNEIIEQSNKIVEGSCPEEINKKSIFVYTTDVYSDALPYRLQVDTKNFVQNKGSFDGYCRVGRLEGENTRYVYCDSTDNYFKYTQKQTIDEEGFIHYGKSWDIIVVFDYITCKPEGNPEINGGIVDWSTLYRCEIISMKCKEV
jgi:hypothetical protein